MEIDARGLSCPQPIILVKKAVDKKEKNIQVKVDDRAALENVKRFGLAMKYDVKVENLTEDEHLLTLNKE